LAAYDLSQREGLQPLKITYPRPGFSCARRTSPCPPASMYVCLRGPVAGHIAAGLLVDCHNQIFVGTMLPALVSLPGSVRKLTSPPPLRGFLFGLGISPDGPLKARPCVGVNLPPSVLAPSLVRGRRSTA
jgi:hypothetical protein